MNWCRNHVKIKSEAALFFDEYSRYPHLEYSFHVVDDGSASISFLTPCEEPKEKMQEVAAHADFIWEAVYEDDDSKYYASKNGEVRELPMCRYHISANYKVIVQFTDKAYDTYLKNLHEPEKDIMMYLFAQCKLQHISHILKAISQSPKDPHTYMIEFSLWDERCAYRIKDLLRLSDRDVDDSFYMSSDSFIPEINRSDTPFIHHMGPSLYQYDVKCQNITIHSLCDNEVFPEESGVFNFPKKTCTENAN